MELTSSGASSTRERSSYGILLILTVVLVGVIASDLAQGAFQFSQFGNFSRAAWAWALMDSEGKEGWFQFNIFVAPALLATAVVVMALDRSREGVRRFGRLYAILCVIEILLSPMAWAGMLLVRSYDVKAIGWGPQSQVFFASLSALRMLACVALLVGVWRLRARVRLSESSSVTHPLGEVQEVSQSAARRGPASDISDVREVVAPTSPSVLAPVCLAVAAVAAFADGFGIAVIDVHSSTSLGVWGALKYGAQDIASATSSDPTALAVPILILLGVVALRWTGVRSNHAKALGRFFAWFAAVELAIMPTFILATIQVNSGNGLQADVWTDFYTWAVVRILVCVAALVGAVSFLRARRGSAHLESRLDNRAPIDGQPVGASDERGGDGLSSPAPVELMSTRTEVDGSREISFLFGLTSALFVLLGVAFVTYDMINPGSAILGGSITGSGWDKLQSALGMLAVGQDGDFVFLFGPICLLLAVVVWPKEGISSRGTRWVLWVAITESVVTVVYVVTSSLSPLGTNGAVDLICWGAARLFICVATGAATIELQRRPVWCEQPPPDDVPGARDIAEDAALSFA